MEQNRQIEIRSEKVRNIIGQVPPVLLRYGISAITFSLLILIFIASIIPYQPTKDTTITVTESADGVLHYTANIPYKTVDRQAKAVVIRNLFADKLSLPAVFRIDSVVDSTYIAADSIWQVAYISPIEETAHDIKLLRSLTLPASIVFPSQSLLSWLIGK